MKSTAVVYFMATERVPCVFRPLYNTFARFARAVLSELAETPRQPYSQHLQSAVFCSTSFFFFFPHRRRYTPPPGRKGGTAEGTRSELILPAE